MTPYIPVLAMALALPSSLAHAMSDAELQAIAAKRLTGDRTGACFAVAVIDKTVSRTFVCADPKNPRAIDGRTAFEIGSVSKTMTAALLAQQIDAGKMSLDDPLSKHLPAGTKVPEFEGKPILLRHIVTHTSGLPALPAKFRPTNPADPYANVTRQDLLDSLAEVKLAQAPGERWAYSNYAMMLMTMILAERSGGDFETLLQRDPDVIILADAVWSPARRKREYLHNHPALSKLRAVREGRLIDNPPRAELADLDALPSVLDVYREHLDVNAYSIGYLLHP